MRSTPSPRAGQLGLRLFGFFPIFAATMAALAAFLLISPGTPLDALWKLNPRAYKDLAPLGAPVGLFFACFSVLLLAIAVGWFRRRLWAWRLSVAVLAAQIAGDLFNALTGHIWEGLIGVSIAGALLFFLLRPPLKSSFS